MPPTVKANAAMRNRSGSVESDDRVAALFYLLARDLVPVGKLEELLDLAAGAEEPVTIHRYTNGFLARWALDAAARLRGEIEVPADGGSGLGETS